MNKLHIKHELWNRGELDWLLYDHQLPIYTAIHKIIADPNPLQNSYYCDISRQYGKSFTIFTVCVELCLRNPGYTICYIAPMKSQAMEIVTQKTFNTIFADCPPNLVPKLSQHAELEFSNGSRIRLSGADNRHYESLRGGASNLNIVDEAGFMDNLIDGVLNTTDPMLKTTKGKTIFASTPAATMDHDSEIVYRNHLEAGQVITFTIYDDKNMTEVDIQREINKCHGEHTTKFKREYLCHHISDASKQVISELTKEVVEHVLLLNNDYRLQPLYKYWKKYVALDWGGKDKTAVLFAHWDYRRKKLLIESHLDIVGTDISMGRIAKEIKTKVETLWPMDHQHLGISYYCDNNNVLAYQDLQITHNIPFIPTTKGSLDAMVQKVRDWIYEDKIEFAPEAEFVLKSAESAIWSPNRDKFAQSKIYGHYDHLAALVYLIRNVDEWTDPLPMLVDKTGPNYFVHPELQQQAKQQHQVAQAIFNPRKGLYAKR